LHVAVLLQRGGIHAVSFEAAADPHELARSARF
jgi:hypothetical protein